MRRFAIPIAFLTLACSLVARAAEIGPDACALSRAATWRNASGVADAAGDLRVYAIQFKHEIRHVETYETFARKMDCLVRELVMPSADLDRDGKADSPTIVAFNEDAGLATIATGSRGAPARALAQHGPKDPQNIPGALSAFASLGPGYAPAIRHYAHAAPETSPQRLILAAATDTFARGFMKTNADIARRYGVYVVSSNNQAEFRAVDVRERPDALALADPDLAHRFADGTLHTVYEAVDVPGDGPGRAGIDVYNQAWMWAPVDGVTEYANARWSAINAGPLTADDPRANVIGVNRKTPLTQIERDVLDLSDDSDMSPANTGPFGLLPEHDPSGRIKIGYGISLPSFMWGTAETGGEIFGTPLRDGVDPCARPTTWMRCLDARGVNLFLQPEANPGRWADYIDTSWKPAAFQSLSWLDSAWRAVADPTVHNIRYAVTPHLVGNLVDLTFDGQSVIVERCLDRGAGTTCDGNTPATFVGASEFVPCVAGVTTRCDDPLLAPYAGAHPEFMVTAPWVLDDCPACAGPIANRERLAARARAMEAGTGSAVENDYLETAIWADLDFD